MESFFLAGGYGKRAKPLSDFYPKALFPLNGKALIHRMMDKLDKAGLKQGFINLYYKAEMLRKNLSTREDLVFFHEKKLSGNKILKKAYDFLQEDFLLVVNGDVYLDIPLQKMIEKVRKYDGDCILLVKKSDSINYRHLIIKDQIFVKRGDLINKNQKQINLFCGVFLIKKKILNQIDEENIFDFLTRKKFKTIVFFYRGLWLDIGTPGFYFKADQIIRRMEDKYAKNSVSKGVRISKDSKVSDSIIWENSIINKSFIKNSIITGNMTINNIECTNKIIIPDKNSIKFFELG